MASSRTGLLIIRAWLEQGSSKPLRAHIRLTTDISTGFTSEVTFADVASASAAVDVWLEEVLLHDPRP